MHPKRILVIRGGAIGDFILTLPALKALRDAYPRAEIHLLGYKHIAELANNRFYANAVRSIEYGPLASFFARNAELPAELADYFAGFDLVLSYLYDPDRIFETNLRRCGLETLIIGPAKLSDNDHAARQLAQPLIELGVTTKDFAARLYPSDEDRQTAKKFLQDSSPPIIAIHPGSGSGKKNWPIENWIELGNALLGGNPRSGDLSLSGRLRGAGGQTAELKGGQSGNRPSLIVVSGEADEEQRSRLDREWHGHRVHFARNLPLPQLAAVLEETTFIGHDSGISHLAAAAGATCTLLFGPTDPAVWAPQGDKVHVLRAPNGTLANLEAQTVLRHCYAVK